MANTSISLILFGISLLFLVFRLITGKKRDFLLSVLFIVLGSAVFAISNGFFVLYLFLIAIILSFLGDLLMAEWIRITQHRTIDGIFAFGLAHIAYIYAFNTLNFGGFEFVRNWILVLIGIVVGFLVYQIVVGGADLPGEIKFSNMIYSFIISGLLVVVLALVISPFNTTYSTYAKISALVGVFLFICSDGVLAYNEFKNKISHAKEIIAITYVIAQILLQITPILLFQ